MNRKPHTEATKKKISEAKKGKKLNHKIDCICSFCKASRGELKGILKSEKTKINMGIAQKKRFENKENHPNYGKKLEDTHKVDCNCCYCKCKKGERKGSNCLAYVDGRTILTQMIRNLDEYRNWRLKVLIKDNYTCQDCFYPVGRLEAHHKKEFHKIFNEFLQAYSKFSPVKDKEVLLKLAIDYKPFWNINNGECLCEDCHNQTKRRAKTC